MKTIPSITIGLAVLVNQTCGHYIFNRLTANGVQGAVYENIRKNTNNNSPVDDLASNDLRCNVGATGAGTSTVSVPAGSPITITADSAANHQGPTSFYMAKAPTTAAEFDGAGEVWFKVKDIGPTFTSSGAQWDLEQSYNVTLPAALPSGDYLFRTQQLAIHNPGAAPQFYISCAQLTVTDGGAGTPGPLVAIPGAFKNTDPGYVVNIYNNFKNYTVPGPEVWAEAGNSGDSSPASPVTNDTPPSPAATPEVANTPAAAPAAAPGVGAALYAQCGGNDYTGPTTCAEGTCKYNNEYYSQCLT